MEDILVRISEAVAEGEAEDAVELVNEALAAGIPPMTVLNEGAAKGMDIVSEAYSEGEAYLPELVLAGDAMSEITDIIFATMDGDDSDGVKAGVVVIGQAKGDVHDIGKNIVSALLAVNGFEVHDLGIDVEVKEFSEAAKKYNANIVIVSTLLTTSLPYLADTLQYLVDTNYRDNCFYAVGGGPVTVEFAQKIKADGWSRTAFDCVEMCKKLVAECKPGQQDTVIVDTEA